jgi:HK97 family phage prohead protease
VAAVSDVPWSRFSAADYDLRQWMRACLIDTGEGDPDSKSRYKLPVKEPGGAVNRGGVHAAAGVLAGARGGVRASEEQKRAAARKLLAIYRDDLDEEPPESLMTMAGMSTSANRAERDSDDVQARAGLPQPFVRNFPLEDISIRSGAGNGRVVEAYAAVFDTPCEIQDAWGHYTEVIDRGAFDRVIDQLRPQGGRENWRIGVFYNHGQTLSGTPSDRHSMPIGVPEEIRPDKRGLFTVTRYHRSDLADDVLEAIREGSISGYSFSGAFRRSEVAGASGRNARPPYRPDAAGNLQVVRRMESTLREYGPTPIPYYKAAAIVGMRAEQILSMIDDDERGRLVAMLRSDSSSPGSPDAGASELDEGTASHEAPAADDPPAEGEHSIEHHQHRLFVLRMQEMCKERGIPL